MRVQVTYSTSSHACFITTLLNGMHTGENNITIVYQHLQAKHKMDDYYQSRIAEMMRAIQQRQKVYNNNNTDYSGY